MSNKKKTTGKQKVTPDEVENSPKVEEAGFNRIQHTKKALLEALRKTLGVVTKACETVGVDRGTYYNYLRDDEQFRADVKDLDNVALDFMESKLMQAMNDGNVTAIIFGLKCKGKVRGWVEKTEVEHTGEVLNKVTIEIVKPDGKA